MGYGQRASGIVHRRRDSMRGGFARAALLWLLAWGAAAALFLAKAAPKSCGGRDMANVAANVACSAPVPSQGHRYKRIEDVKVGDWVLAKDPGEMGPPSPHRVVAVPRNWTEHLVHVAVRGADGSAGEVQATRSHPFWVDGRGWTNAIDLRPGDRLTDDQGRSAVAASVRVEGRTADTFNLTVEGVHTYFVSAGDTPVLVHNAPFPEMAPGPGGGLGAKAPDQIAPTGKPEVLSGQYVDDVGQVARWTAQYDNFGRQVERTDFTDLPGHTHPNPHHHTRVYGPGTGGKGEESDPIPGEGPNTGRPCD